MTALDTPEIAPLTRVPAGSEDDSDDAGYGWVMFFGFVVAVVAISLAVCVLALAPSWWVLGAAVATHLGVTASMMKIVLGAFGPESEAYPELARVEPAVGAGPSPRVTDLRKSRVSLAAHH